MKIRTSSFPAPFPPMGTGKAKLLAGMGVRMERRPAHMDRAFDLTFWQEVSSKFFPIVSLRIKPLRLYQRGVMGSPVIST